MCLVKTAAGASKGAKAVPSDQANAKLQSGKDEANEPTWGRNKHVKPLTWVIVAFLLFFAPVIVEYVVVCMTQYDGALSGPINDLFLAEETITFSEFLIEKVYKPIAEPEGFFLQTAKIYVTWLLFQALLAVTVPGPIGYGQSTPAGHKLEYLVNGLNCWVVTHIFFVVGAWGFGWWKPTIIYDHWAQLSICMHLYGFALSLFCYIKAFVAPTHAGDVKTSDSMVFNFFMGVEFNPRIGSLDFKLFHNGRIGIILWTLVNISCAAAQYERHGDITNSMIMVNIGHAVYVLDFFFNEDWYLRTIDICHDHFGFYLAWGDAVWLPIMYALQSPFMVTHPHELNTNEVVVISAFFCLGYYIFRDVNHQKDIFRSSNGKALIWGKKATYIDATYVTADGSTRNSLLLTSGWWGVARHSNYLADLLMSLCFCLVTGYTHALPYFYICQMICLLVGRIYRDEGRCKGKYGKFWDEYCAQVPYRLIPGIW
ncbi:hypothetical protein, variant [Sphaeroforma arctica JP610]|uniref:7-dehydrocholesterol reductase n=1 Tax=Sphaeroforma arctica JP610 TaxID=667725 RepID=A0A0L0GFC2_9EUKA|nr:hypothetical protein, variant [Sphaeroforma arctica JP610]KNC87712.1 hypothetical protein, variant [Sphaeroforma arctica JP610]|eukprot:XP_014161614.1 hypothetical protein, variant [Sphaeroforma arctica JP610]